MSKTLRWSRVPPPHERVRYRRAARALAGTRAGCTCSEDSAEAAATMEQVSIHDIVAHEARLDARRKASRLQAKSRGRADCRVAQPQPVTSLRANAARCAKHPVSSASGAGAGGGDGLAGGALVQHRAEHTGAADAR